MDIEFNTSLGDGDWDRRLAGWRCDALLIPSTKVIAIYHDGIKADTTSYSIERSMIRWSETSKPRPKEILVGLSITKDFPGLEEEKLNLEKEKLNLEQQKARIENRWKAIAAVGTTLSFLITLGATHLLGQTKQAKSLQSQASIQAKVGQDTIKLLQLLPTEGLDIIFRFFERSSRNSSSSKKLIATSQKSNEFLVPNYYENLKRLEELGFIEFSIPSAEFDVVLSRLQPASSKPFGNYRYFTEVTPLSPSQRETLTEQSYQLTDRGRLVLDSSIAVIQEQINQGENK